MPRFEVIQLEDAKVKAATGKRAAITREYIGYIEQIRAGQAGKLEPVEGESAASIRRRLLNAAKMAGKDLVIKRVGDGVYFWINPDKVSTPKRLGRPRKEPSIES